MDVQEKWQLEENQTVALCSSVGSHPWEVVRMPAFLREKKIKERIQVKI